MTQEEILEGNKLIAVFSGGKYISDGDSIWMGGKLIHLSDLKYHSSWDWLMPVVEKIVEIDITPAPNWTGYRVEIVPRGYVKISGFPMPTITTNFSIEGSLIMAVWKAVVEFIKWYNQQ